MKNEQWHAVYSIFKKVDELTGKLKTGGLFKFLPDSVQKAFAKKEAHKEPDDPGEGNGGDIIQARSEIRTQLDILRSDLAEMMSERDGYLVLFPIVIHIDELIQSEYLRDNQSWPPLQKELFGIDDGGIQFYETMNDLLRKPDTHPFIFEVFYFCMSHGFQGRYVDNRVKINESMKKLKNKIPLEDIKIHQSSPDPVIRIRQFISPLWSYAVAGVVIVSCYLVISFYAGRQDFGGF